MESEDKLDDKVHKDVLNNSSTKEKILEIRHLSEKKHSDNELPLVVLQSSEKCGSNDVSQRLQM